MDRLSNDPRFAKVIRFVIDFNSERAYLRQLEVVQQGTLIAFKGKTEKARFVGETDPDALRKVFEAALRKPRGEPTGSRVCHTASTIVRASFIYVQAIAYRPAPAYVRDRWPRDP